MNKDTWERQGREFVSNEHSLSIEEAFEYIAGSPRSSKLPPSKEHVKTSLKINESSYYSLACLVCTQLAVPPRLFPPGFKLPKKVKK